MSDKQKERKICISHEPPSSQLISGFCPGGPQTTTDQPIKLDVNNAFRCFKQFWRLPRAFLNQDPSAWGEKKDCTYIHIVYNSAVSQQGFLLTLVSYLLNLRPSEASLIHLFIHHLVRKWRVTSASALALHAYILLPPCVRA